MTVSVRQLSKSEVGKIAHIDRSERVTLGYSFNQGKLETEDVDWHVPRWSEDIQGEFNIDVRIHELSQAMEEGCIMIGALEGDLLVGFIVLRVKLTENMDQVHGLFVSREYRRQGIATNLMSEVVRMAREGGAEKLYVSSIPSESAVGFYMHQGFELAEQVHPELFVLEPEDIHMIKTL
jgi:GNAT superfamily N-acetyltransferase